MPYVGSAPDEIRPYFTEVRLLAAGGPDPREAGVWLCADRTQDLATLWPQLRHLDVDQRGT